MFSLILLVVVTGLWLVQTAVSRMAAVVIGAAFWSVVAVVARVLGALLEGSDAVVGTAPFNSDDSMDIEASDALLALGIPVYGDDDANDDDDDSMGALGTLLIPSIIITPPEEDDLADDSTDSICESALAFTDSHQTTIYTQPDEAAMDHDDDDDDDSNPSVDSAYGHIQNHLEERTRGVVTEFYELPAHERESSVEEEQGEQVSETSPSLVSQAATVVSARPNEAIELEVVAEPPQASRSVHTPRHKEDYPEEYQSVDSGSPASTPILVSEGEEPAGNEDASAGSSPTSSTTAFSDGTMASADSPSDDGEKLVKVDAPVGRCPCCAVPRVRWIHLLNAKPELTFLTTCSHRPPGSSVGDVVKKPGVVKRTKTALKKVLRRRKGGDT